MFTLTDIRNIAVQIERNGETTYRKAGELSTNADLARTLIWMADEELRHTQWFEAMASDRITMDPSQREVEQMGRALLQEMMTSQTFSLESDQLNEADNIVALLSQSLNFEQDTILFYEMLGSFIDDPEILGQLDRIIEEERNHVAHIERMKKEYANVDQPS